MPLRKILGRAKKPEGVVWFTLVVEDKANYFVEQYGDANFPLTIGKFKIILPGEFADHQMDDMPLAKAVEKKLEELQKTT